MIINWDEAQYGLTIPVCCTGIIPQNFNLTPGKLVFGNKTFTWDTNNKNKPLMDIFCPEYNVIDTFDDFTWEHMNRAKERQTFFTYKNIGIVIPNVVLNTLKIWCKSTVFGVFFNFNDNNHIVIDYCRPGDNITWNHLGFYVEIAKGDIVKVNGNNNLWTLTNEGNIKKN